MSNSSGFSIIEVLVALLIVSIFATLSYPAWHHLIHKNKLEISTQNLLQFLKTSRQLALQKKQSVIVCPSHDKIHCSDFDSINVLIARGDVEKLLEMSMDSNNTTIRWMSNLGKNDQLMFMPTGMTNGQQGHFTLFSTTTLQKAEVVVLMSGSVYVRSMNLSIAETK